jgi:hypothetical protein
MDVDTKENKRTKSRKKGGIKTVQETLKKEKRPGEKLRGIERTQNEIRCQTGNRRGKERRKKFVCGQARFVLYIVPEIHKKVSKNLPT